MERSKGLILIVVVLAAVLIIWQVAFRPNPATENKENDSDQGQTRQPAGEVTDQIPDSGERMQPGTGEQSERYTQRRQRDNTNSDRRNTVTRAENTSFKIAIPKNIETAKLRVLYEEYLEISNSFGRGRSGRTSRSFGRGGFDSFPDFGNMEMPDFSNMPMPEGMPNFDEMRQMMESMGMEEMMNNMRGRGGMMGGRGGFGDFGGFDGQMDMGGDFETNTEEENTENNY